MALSFQKKLETEMSTKKTRIRLINLCIVFRFLSCCITCQTTLINQWSLLFLFDSDESLNLNHIRHYHSKIKYEFHRMNKWPYTREIKSEIQ